MTDEEFLTLPLALVEGAPWYPRMLRRCVRISPDWDQDKGCLFWCGARSRGGERSSEKAWYGSLDLGRGEGNRVVRTHVAVATAHGIITDFIVPAGHNLDHVCNRSLCVEHSHLELVTKLENQRRKVRRQPRPLSVQQEEEIRSRGIRPLSWWSY